MIIGKGGQMLKKIASAARMDCEELLGARVNLQCWVKVREDWRDNDRLLDNLGFCKAVTAGRLREPCPTTVGQLFHAWIGMMVAS